MRSLMILGLVFCLAVFGLLAGDSTAEAHDAPPGVYTFGTMTGSISASNAVIGSLVAADKQLVIRTIQVHSTQTGVLTITDGATGVAKLCIGVLADTPRSLTAEEIGPQGIPLTKGNEPYVNALSSATVAISYSGTLE
jgi:hypothetical protein